MISSQEYLPCFLQFYSEMKKEYERISLSAKDIQDRKDLIQFVRNKLKNREFEEDQDQQEAGQSYYDTGFQIEIFGSYGSGLSTKNSDIDMRVNDPYTYRYLNLGQISANLTFVKGYYRNKNPIHWTGPKSKNKRSRLEVIEYLSKARVPILKMKDRVTQIEFDISQGSSSVNNRHIAICRESQKLYPQLKTLVLILKKYLANRDCDKSYSGGISSFLLFYMVLAYF